MSEICLVPPVTYQGGKQRIAKNIVDIILERNVKIKNFYDLCCGSGAITIEIYNRNIPFENLFMCDISIWGDFWKSIGSGTFVQEMFDIYIQNIPKEKTEIKSYLEMIYKESPYDGVFISEVYRFLILQAGAFGGKQVWIENGKWKNGSFRSFWQPTETSNRRSPVNPMMPMPETLLKRVSDLWSELYGMVRHTEENDVTKIHKFEEDSIIYIDPPYSNATGYGNSFDVIKWVKERKANNPTCAFYVSEKCPIGEKSFRISENRKKGNISGNGKMNEEWLTEIK